MIRQKTSYYSHRDVKVKKKSGKYGREYTCKVLKFS